MAAASLICKLEAVTTAHDTSGLNTIPVASICKSACCHCCTVQGNGFIQNVHTHMLKHVNRLLQTCSVGGQLFLVNYLKQRSEAKLQHHERRFADKSPKNKT